MNPTKLLYLHLILVLFLVVACSRTDEKPSMPEAKTETTETPQREVAVPLVDSDEDVSIAEMEAPITSLSPEQVDELNQLAESARKRGAVPPVIFDQPHGVSAPGDIDALRAIIAAAQPGDVIEVPTGVYENVGAVELAADGLEAKRIILRAKEPGKAVFTGESSMLVKGDYWTVEGLRFDHAIFSGKQYHHVFAVSGGNGVRVTNCAFISCGSPDILYMAMMSWKDGADNGRVDHCTFVDSLSMNLQIRVGPEENDTAKGILIDHNHFRDIRRRHVNGGEAVQIGGDPQKWGRMRADAVVEYNRFERADGDDEVISNKSSGNIIRKNTFIGCGGAVWLRGGTDCEISGNLWRGGSSGIVAHGANHLISGNVIQETHSYAFMAQYGSDWENVENAGHSFEALQESTIEKNAIINPVNRGIVYGAFRMDNPHNRYRTVAPFNNVFQSNVLTSKRGKMLIAERFGETRFNNNMLYLEGSAKLGDQLTGFRVVSAERAVSAMPRVEEIKAEDVGASWLR